ncbi:carbonic anhydrase [Pilibacter termitis]|uniref:carbonic anhydrase n=2 Tax=Pilibacter termitis TaxID=263852 RepID=A0A1T4LCQ9_9ENTE|nr:carbonic anhydrase [Pilibacter termitis]
MEEWDYLENGPHRWEELCDEFKFACQKHMQSPIALSTEKVTNSLDKDFLQLHYEEDIYKIRWSKHTFHFLPKNKKNRVKFNDNWFYLEDIHFHLPSEHSIDGKSYPIEFHLVHYSKAREVLVVAVLFDCIQNTFRGGKASREHSVFEWVEGCDEVEIDLSQFILSKSSYYAYYGSFTTPPCRGDIHWVVFSEIASLSSRTLFSFLEKYGWRKNNRPIQEQLQKKIWYAG